MCRGNLPHYPLYVPDGGHGCSLVVLAEKQPDFHRIEKERKSPYGLSTVLYLAAEGMT